jgi:hypothetical protein
MHRLRVPFVLAASLCLAAVSATRAQQATPTEYPGIETGKMWTFDVPPLDYWARRYNFHPTQAWLDHVRLAAGRLPGCSASFVSPDGLILTNHHCGRRCIESATRSGEDLLQNGFYASSRGEERACRGVYIDQLLSITDVTDSVNAAVPSGTAADRAATLRDRAIAGIAERCGGGDPRIKCQVVTMYRGGQYKLYRFHHYTDLRLVFAVESQTGRTRTGSRRTRIICAGARTARATASWCSWSETPAPRGASIRWRRWSTFGTCSIRRR